MDRLLWAVVSRYASSTWPMLFLDIVLCLGSSAVLVAGRFLGAGAFEPTLWIAAVGLGLGVSSGLPCVYSLPAEARVHLGPKAITVLNAASTLGETSMPYIIGLAFGKQHHWLLGALMTALMAAALTVATLSWRLAARYGREGSSEYEF